MDISKLRELYYVICKPEERNKNTNNFVLPVNPNSYLNKDFVFYQEVNGQQYYKVISRFYVKKYAQKFFYQKTDELTKEVKTLIFYYITFYDIIGAPELNQYIKL